MAHSLSEEHSTAERAQLALLNPLTCGETSGSEANPKADQPERVFCLSQAGGQANQTKVIFIIISGDSGGGGGQSTIDVVVFVLLGARRVSFALQTKPNQTKLNQNSEPIISSFIVVVVSGGCGSNGTSTNN